MFNTNNKNPRVYESAGLYSKDNNQSANYHTMKVKNRFIYSAELNLYAHLSKSTGKSGIFGRFAIDFDITKNVFPRILVGYSTNLDSYIGGLRSSK